MTTKTLETTRKCMQQLTMAALFSALGETKRVEYMPNHGNVGDSLIAFGTYSLLDRLGVKIVSRAETLLVSGGANLVPYYDYLVPQLSKINRSRRIILLPSTTYGREEFLKSFQNLTLIARDEATYTNAVFHGVHSLLAHDAAFSIDFEPYVKKSAKTTQDVLQAFRTDSEAADASRCKIRNNRDLSREHPQRIWNVHDAHSEASWFISEIAQYRRVKTDRLHIAIAATMLGKEVHLYSNSYYKNYAVYSSSLARFSNCSFIDDDSSVKFQFRPPRTHVI